MSSVSKLFISKMLGEESPKMQRSLSEVGIVDDGSFFKCPLRRTELARIDPSAFAGVSSNGGTPIFPVKTQFGTTNLDLLSQSLNSARSHFHRTADEKYADAIHHIQSKIDKLKTGEDRTPIHGDVNPMLKDIFNRNTAYIDKD